MKILNFGSLNLDYVYKVPHMAAKGETILSTSREIHQGGKGLNQSVALAKAGAEVYHAGCIGTDGSVLIDYLRKTNVDTRFIITLEDIASGHAIIQNDSDGDNCIVLFGGANYRVTRVQIENTLSAFSAGDYLFLQNEINDIPYIVDRAYSRGMKIVLNPSPYNNALRSVDFSKIDYLILNEIEAMQIMGIDNIESGEALIQGLLEKFRHVKIVLTLGAQGSLYGDDLQTVRQDIFKVRTVDTTAAGDTFTGFFMEGIMEGMEPGDALSLAAKASSVAVSRKGAAPSIPWRSEI